MGAGSKKTSQDFSTEATLKLLEFLERHKQEDKEDRRLIYESLNEHSKDDKEDRRLMYQSLNKHAESIDKILPLVEGCYKDLNGNGQPGLKKIVNSHVSVQKWVSATVIAVISGVTGLVIANWSAFLAHFYTFMKIIEWWNKHHQQ